MTIFLSSNVAASIWMIYHHAAASKVALALFSCIFYIASLWIQFICQVPKLEHFSDALQAPSNILEMLVLIITLTKITGRVDPAHSLQNSDLAS